MIKMAAVMGVLVLSVIVTVAMAAPRPLFNTSKLKVGYMGPGFARSKFYLTILTMSCSLLKFVMEYYFGVKSTISGCALSMACKMTFEISVNLYENLY